MTLQSLYKPEYCAAVLEYGKEGASRAQMARNLGVDRKTIDNWRRQHPEFNEAIEVSLDFSQAWWEDQVQKGMWSGNKFNALAWHKSMVARFRNEYGDSSKLELTAKPGDVPEEQATARAAALLGQAARRRADTDDDAGGLA